MISSSTDVIRFQDCLYYFQILQVHLHRIHRPQFCYKVRRLYYFFYLMQSIFVLFFYNICYWLYFLLSLFLDIEICLLLSKINIYNSLFIRYIFFVNETPVYWFFFNTLSRLFILFSDFYIVHRSHTPKFCYKVRWNFILFNLMESICINFIIYVIDSILLFLFLDIEKYIFYYQR